MVSHTQRRWRELQVAPRIAWAVLRSVDANEGAEAVVGVHAESVGSGDVHVEWDADVESDIFARSTKADVLIPQDRCARYVASA